MMMVSLVFLLELLARGYRLTATLVHNVRLVLLSGELLLLLQLVACHA